MRHTIMLCSILLLAGCAAQQPQIAVRPVEKKAPPSPEAVAHYMRAQMAEKQGMREEAIQELRAATAYDTTSATIYAALARNLNATQKYTEALSAAHHAVAINPKDMDNHWELYQALFNGPQDTTAALAELETIVSLDKYQLKAYDQMLQIYSARQQSQNVIKTLDRIMALPGLGTREKMIAAQNYSRYGANDRAEAIFKQVVQEDPKNDEAWFDLGVSQFAATDTLAAEKTFRQALSRDQFQVTQQNAQLWGQLVRIYRKPDHLQRLLSEAPLDTLLVKNMGQVFLDMAQDPKINQQDRTDFYHSAEGLLDGLLKLNPNQEDLLAEKAQLLLETGRPEEARAYFHQANMQTERAEYELGTAHTYIAQGDWDNARQLLEKLHAAAPANAQVYPQIVTDLARIYMRLGDTEKARGVYQQAAKNMPDQPVYRYELARTFMADKAWDKALPLLEPLAGETEDTPDLLMSVLFDLGTSYERAGKIEQSIATFQRLLTLQPDNAGANNYLGYMLAERGKRLTEAKIMIERAVQAEPHNGAYLDSMGWVYFQQGDYKQAMKYLSQALAIEEGNLRKANDSDSRTLDSLHENLAVIHEHAGDTAKALGDLDTARRHYERALQFDAANSVLIKKIRALSEAPGDLKGL